MTSTSQTEAHPICRHCKKPERVVIRGHKGLCHGCYEKPKIRKKYRSINKHGKWANPKPKWRKEKEPTEAQLDRLIARQRKKLPRWWESSWRKMEAGDMDE